VEKVDGLGERQLRRHARTIAVQPARHLAVRGTDRSKHRNFVLAAVESPLAARMKSASRGEIPEVGR
jgi:hypothetical protein